MREPLRDPSGATTEQQAVIDEAWAHRTELMLYARRLLGAQGELAEDVVQEAYLRLHERLSAGSAVRESRPWLFRVTRNLALDERRRTRRGDAVRTSLEVVATQPRGPLEVLQGREDAREALEGIDALPPRERRTVILDQAGLAPTAIAHRMQTTTNAVHQSLFRARRRMRDVRAAAWGLVPLPLIRLFVRAAGSPVLEGVPALAPGSGGRLAGGAGIVSLVAAAVIGGGVAVDHHALPHHGRAHPPAATAGASPPAAAPAYAEVARSGPPTAFVATSVAGPAPAKRVPEAPTRPRRAGGALPPEVALIADGGGEGDGGPRSADAPRTSAGADGLEHEDSVARWSSDASAAQSGDGGRQRPAGGSDGVETHAPSDTTTAPTTTTTTTTTAAASDTTDSGTRVRSESPEHSSSTDEPSPSSGD